MFRRVSMVACQQDKHDKLRSGWVVFEMRGPVNSNLHWIAEILDGCCSLKQIQEEVGPQEVHLQHQQDDECNAVVEGQGQHLDTVQEGESCEQEDQRNVFLEYDPVQSAE